MIGRCHCGAVVLDIVLTGGLTTAHRCDCSFCSRRGAIAVSAPLNGVKILQGAENLTLYQFNTGTAKHYFCKTCGIHTHHQRRSNPDQLGINVACLAGVSPFDFPEVTVMDGVNHPSDTDKGPRIAGVLRFAQS